MDNTRLPTDSWFGRFAKWVSRRAGHALSFALALGVVLLWALSGPVVGYGNTWQLTINTVTTIVTFLMVFLIQNSQTRDSEAIHVKLDELIESTKGARRELLDLEEMPEEELHRLQQQYEALAAQARRRHHGRSGARGRRRPTPFQPQEAENSSRPSTKDGKTRKTRVGASRRSRL